EGPTTSPNGPRTAYTGVNSPPRWRASAALAYSGAPATDGVAAASPAPQPRAGAGRGGWGRGPSRYAAGRAAPPGYPGPRAAGPGFASRAPAIGPGGQASPPHAEIATPLWRPARSYQAPTPACLASNSAIRMCRLVMRACNCSM